MLELANEDIKDQYTLLGILDAKSASLLTFNALFLATLSSWLGYVPLNVMHLALDLVFLALLVSCSLLLFVIRLRWSTPAETLAELNAVRELRSSRYRGAWRISVACVGAVLLVSAVHTAGTALAAVGACREGSRCAWFFGEGVFGNLDVRPAGK